MQIDYGTNRLDDKPQSDVFKTSIYGFNKQLQAFFPDKKVPVQMVPNGVSSLRELIKKRRTLNVSDQPFPMFAVSLSDSADKTDGYNNFALHRRGVILKSKSFTATAPNANQRTQVGTIRAHLSAMTQAITVSLLTETEKDIYDFVPRWIDCCRYRYLSFQIYTENDVAPPLGFAQLRGSATPEAAIDIRVEGDKQVQYPDLEMEETGNMFTVQVNATMNTYSGVITNQLSIGGGKINYILANQENQPTTQANLEQRTV